MSRFWNFKNSQTSEDDVELRISGEIVIDDNAWIYDWFGIPNASPNSFRDELSAYKGKNVTVWIDSYGGDVFAGAGIYNALKNHDGKVITVIDGKAMSAASVIAMAGEEIHMSPVGLMMIHNPLTGAQGEAKDMRKAADVLDEVKETIMNAYQLKTGKSRSKISEMMDNQTYMSAKTALAQGFVDKILYSDKKIDAVENNFAFSQMSIQNSMADTMKKFFEVVKDNQLEDSTLPSAPQAKAPEPQPDANIDNVQEGDIPMYKDLKELRDACPELVKQIEDAAREEGKNSERTRIQDIEKISKSISSDLVNKAKFEEPMDAKELAFQAMQNDTGKGKTYLANAQQDSNDSGTNNVPAAPASQSTEEEKLAAENKAVDSIAAGGNRRRVK